MTQAAIYTTTCHAVDERRTGLFLCVNQECDGKHHFFVNEERRNNGD